MDLRNLPQITCGKTEITDNMSITAQEKFETIYNKAPVFGGFTPYRICPVGAHIDHNLGIITGFAIDKGVHIAYSPSYDGKVKVFSLQFEGEKEWDVKQIPFTKQNDWADYLRGVCIALSKRYEVKTGIISVISGELPIGGLSSSAAVTISFLNALCKVNGITLSSSEIIDISREAENKYVGVNSGKLDQCCEVYCKKNALLTMDLTDDSKQIIPAHPDMKKFDILVFFSGLERCLASSGYNNRVAQLRSGAYKLLKASGKAVDSPDEANMRFVPYEFFAGNKDILTDDEIKRAEHFFTEMQRVGRGIAAWKSGDIEAFGAVSRESGESSINNWEAGSPELIEMHRIINSTDGIYGGRFSGAGFKGCCMAFADPSRREEVLAAVQSRYLEAFPYLSEKYTACVCSTADGVN